ncbi:MAG TPA: NB-ARC domain-containing protein, partial [Acidimicrobiales bacterium]|nr:NB-ARC domain-containing protein [Acidimicrobiales bacterium]
MRGLGDAAYAAVLSDHHRLVRDALAAAGGREVTNQGDGFFAAFTSPSAGAAAAVAIQRSMASHAWPADVEPRVRIGVHVGEATWTDAGLVGFEIHRAARIAAVGHGGQVLLSAAAAGLVESSLAPELGLRDLGAHRLKDLGRPETIFQLVIPGLRDGFPPLKSLDNPELPNNLPASLSPFIGRGAEIAEVVDAIGRARLVTLTGAGGSGKTRLALQAAAELLDGSGEGVWLVELASLVDQEGVAPSILAALSTHPEAGESPQEAIVRALRSQYLLLILDNCEHVIDEVAKVADQVTRNCPQVKLLATSREPLGVDGEEVLRVRSMALPAGDVSGVEDVTGIDAVDLFVARARSHDRDFVLTDEGAVLVASICRRLDGIPLAVELAAARTATMSLADLHDRLDQRFRLLTGGSRNVLPRQQTLAATVAWSYDLLNEPERAVLRRLTVFVDGFDLAAAESVCAQGDIESFDVDQILGSLATKNLVGVDRENGDVRYRLLETVRQFAAEQFVARGDEEVDSSRRRHAEHFVALAETGSTRVRRGETVRWFHWCGREWGNLKAAVQYLLESGRGVD